MTTKVLTLHIVLLVDAADPHQAVALHQDMKTMLENYLKFHGIEYKPVPNTAPVTISVADYQTSEGGDVSKTL